MAPCLKLRYLDVFEALVMIDLSAAYFQGLIKVKYEKRQNENAAQLVIV